MKMADVFPQPVDRLDVGDIRSFERLAAAHAINCHDELVEALRDLRTRFHTMLVSTGT